MLLFSGTRLVFFLSREGGKPPRTPTSPTTLKRRGKFRGKGRWKREREGERRVLMVVRLVE